MNFHQIAKFTLKSSIGSPGGFPEIFLTMEKTASMLCDVSGDMCPTSLPYSIDFPGQLKNWLRVQGVAPKLYNFGQQILLCSTRSQPQDCQSLLNLLLLLDATGLPAAFPSTRQGMHPSVALEKSTLRRMSLIQNSSCCRVSAKLSASPDF